MMSAECLPSFSFEAAPRLASMKSACTVPSMFVSPTRHPEVVQEVVGQQKTLDIEKTIAKLVSLSHASVDLISCCLEMANDDLKEGLVLLDRALEDVGRLLSEFDIDPERAQGCLAQCDLNWEAAHAALDYQLMQGNHTLPVGVSVPHTPDAE